MLTSILGLWIFIYRLYSYTLVLVYMAISSRTHEHHKCSPEIRLAQCFFFSSEDELDILLSGTPEQKKKLIREYLTGESESSSGDEFEKEMEAELSSTMKSLECSWTASSAQGFTDTRAVISVTVTTHIIT